MPKYLSWALSSRHVFEQATKFATGSAQLTVPLRGIQKLKFLLPSMSEQQRIVAYLDELQTKVYTMRRLREQAMKELDALLPSILEKAFQGEL